VNNLEDPEWVEVFQEFAVESREQLEQAEAMLIGIERDRMQGRPINTESVGALFRTFHTVKGTAGFLTLDRTVHVAHDAENLLARVRSGELLPESDHITALCHAVDFLVASIAHVSRTGDDSAMADEATLIVDTLVALNATPAAGNIASLPPVAEPEAQGPGATAHDAAPRTYDAPPSLYAPEGSAGAMPAEPSIPALAAMSLSFDGAQPAPAQTLTLPTASQPHSPAHTEARPPAAQPAEAPPEPSPPKPRRAPAPSASGKKTPQPRDTAPREVIRVDAARVDALLNMIGELVIAENMTSREVGEALPNSRGLLQLQRVTRQLQDITMSIRMVPVQGVFRKMHRLVRDLTKKQGKLAELIVIGEDTEVDKSLVDSLGDPLVHILRNAIDHGLETPEDRVAAGKQEQGTLTLEASHHGGEVHIQVRDNGRGIDRDRVLARARERGLIEDGRELPDADVFQLLFEPGFSTVEKVTDVSGRGVGMDVVKRNVERFNGRVIVSSTPGLGTTMTLRVPLTLAIVDGMLLRVGEQTYTVPMIQVKESIPLQETSITDLPGSGELVEIRGTFVPFLRLSTLFDVKSPPPRDPEEPDQSIVVFLDGADGLVGILVDEVLGQQQTVIKPMPPLLAHVSAASGCCILGDGRVSLIIDGNALSTIGRSSRGKGGMAA